MSIVRSQVATQIGAVVTAAVAGLALLTPAPASAASAASIGWQPCQAPSLAGFECGTLDVPIDESHPAKGDFTLAVVRHRSTGTADERIGSLFFNPGGPGISGVGDIPLIWSWLPDDAKARFDLVTWDPRGIGASEPHVDCEVGQLRVPITGPVNWTQAQAALRASTAQANAACWKRYADVLPYVGTNAAVRDLDMLREAVGDDQLTYWGQSYGTRIGYTYALAHPDRVRAILLDGPVNPNDTFRGFIQGYGTAADAALTMFFQTYPEARDRFVRSLAALKNSPLTLPSGAVYSQWSFLQFAEMIARGERLWPDLVRHITLVDNILFAADDKQEQRRAALDAIVRDLPMTNVVSGPSTVISSIDCLDYPDRMSSASQDAVAQSARRQAPIGGWMNSIVLAVQCDGLPITPDPVPTSFGQVDGSRILISASTKDAATPYRWSVEMARAFPGARTVTYVGGQHVNYGAADSPCVNAAVSTFLISGVQPGTDIACANVGRRN